MFIKTSKETQKTCSSTLSRIKDIAIQSFRFWAING